MKSIAFYERIRYNESDRYRIYEQMEHLQITLDNRDNISPELYEQAAQEMENLMCKLRNIHKAHTL